MPADRFDWKPLARARKLLSEMGDVMLASPWRMVSGEQQILTIPRTALLRSTMLNHSYHHRGQLTVYSRQVGHSFLRYTVPAQMRIPLARKS